MRILLSAVFAIISISMDAQMLSMEELIKLVPDKIQGYRRTEEPRTNQLKIGDISYSICQKGFSAGAKQITILLFDFKNASIMYSQVTREWSKYQPIVSDSVVLRPIVEPNYFGWESANVLNRSSKIFLGVSNRFYLAIDGKNVDVEDLKEIIKLFPLEGYPE